MKAVFIREHGDPSVLEYGELPDPTPGPGEVLLRVRATALNRLDLYTRDGSRGTRRPDADFPHVLGGDCAGDVLAVAGDISAPLVGERVVVNPYLGNHPSMRMLGTSRQGSNAELVVVPAENAVTIPESLSYEQAAALPTVFLPAWRIVTGEGALQASETALVISASSGVGTAAIQVIKKVVGAKCIAATSTGAKVRAARELGADFTINYETEDLGSRLSEITRKRGVDLVVDPTGARFFGSAYGSLARGGRYGVCGVTSGYDSHFHMGQLFSRELKLFGVFMGPTHTLRDIVRAASRGLIHSVIHRVYPLGEARAAHEELERSEHFGKIVLSVDS